MTKFIYLQWNSFRRAAGFGRKLTVRIILGLLLAYFIVVFLVLGIGAFFALQEMGLEPLATVNRYLVYYLAAELCVRLLLQQIPVLNIRALLVLPIKRAGILHFSLAKTALSFFNWLPAFFLLPFGVVLISQQYDTAKVCSWIIAVWAFIYCNNFLNILLSNKDRLLSYFLLLLLLLGLSQYFKLFDISLYGAAFFDFFFQRKGGFLLPLIFLALLYYWSFCYLGKELFLDAGLQLRNEEAKGESFGWLERFGTLGAFLRNDLRLIKRNKRAWSSVGISVLFLFYGLLLFPKEGVGASVMDMFAAIFISGGFLFAFGQFVPSWDSAYYRMLMTQCISYRLYLNSKWWLIVLATIITAVLASFYLILGWEVYLVVLVGALYNIGVNSQLVLLSGAFTKTPIDLDMNRGAFAQKKSFNINRILFGIPYLLLPCLLYGLCENPRMGMVLVALSGLLGLVLRDFVFTQIERIYRNEKYKAVEAFKETA